MHGVIILVEIVLLEFRYFVTLTCQHDVATLWYVDSLLYVQWQWVLNDWDIYIFGNINFVKPMSTAKDIHGVFQIGTSSLPTAKQRQNQQNKCL